MTIKTFNPSPKYVTKQRLAFGLIALPILLFGLFLAIPITLESGSGLLGGTIIVTVTAFIAILFWAVAAVLVQFYYRTLRYEILADEVIVHVGLVTKSVKHVPYRTVTNITVNRGILDRLFGLGSLNVQTAGMSGQTGAEENLVGLGNVQEVYELVAGELRRFRTAMSPTATDLEPAAVGTHTEVLTAILEEVRAIRASTRPGAPTDSS